MFPLKDDNPSRSVSVVNYFLLLANVLVFLVEISMNPQELARAVHEYGVVPLQFLKHLGSPDAVLTIFTSMFMHAGWLHLISNMWALWIFGDNIEDRLGHFQYLLFYLFCGVVAAVTQVLLQPEQAAPTIGASGAIAGVLGAYVMLFPGARIMTLIPIGFIPWFINIPAYFYLGFWFWMQVFTGIHSLHVVTGTATENIAFFAHVGGFVAGFLLVRLCQKSDYRQRHSDAHQDY
jgi:membrane associated rhomboid family serine protease